MVRGNGGQDKLDSVDKLQRMVRRNIAGNKRIGTSGWVHSGSHEAQEAFYSTC